MKKENNLQCLAKNIVLHCFRNTHLENIHAGKKCGGVSDGFSDVEMKKLMIECVDNVYTFLYAMTTNHGFSGNMEWWINANFPRDWNTPKLKKDWLKSQNGKS